jgi:succinoglycan biosynthesis protein ExoV
LKITYCEIPGGSFGDDLNSLIWPRLFPDLPKLNGKVLFYGIETLLDGRHDQMTMKVVLGTGIGEKGSPRTDSNWDFRWVRGPQSAQAFKLSSELALGDSALLWPDLLDDADSEGPIGLIPHYAAWDNYDWVGVANGAGMVAINPRQSPLEVIARMRRCSRILTESLHGAICADAMSIPWSACILAHRFNEFKWRDWLAAVSRPFSPLILVRPLVRAIGSAKAIANRLARWIKYREHTRFPALRPVSVATSEDVSQVSKQLSVYGNCNTNFTCSHPSDVRRQRERMLAACRDFAKDYAILFTP